MKNETNAVCLAMAPVTLKATRASLVGDYTAGQNYDLADHNDTRQKHRGENGGSKNAKRVPVG